MTTGPDFIIRYCVLYDMDILSVPHIHELWSEPLKVPPFYLSSAKNLAEILTVTLMGFL